MVEGELTLADPRGEYTLVWWNEGAPESLTLTVEGGWPSFPTIQSASEPWSGPGPFVARWSADDDDHQFEVDLRRDPGGEVLQRSGLKADRLELSKVKPGRYQLRVCTRRTAFAESVSWTRASVASVEVHPRPTSLALRTTAARTTTTHVGSAALASPGRRGRPTAWAAGTR